MPFKTTSFLNLGSVNGHRGSLSFPAGTTYATGGVPFPTAASGFTMLVDVISTGLMDATGGRLDAAVVPGQPPKLKLFKAGAELTAGTNLATLTGSVILLGMA